MVLGKLTREVVLTKADADDLMDEKVDDDDAVHKSS